MELYRQVLVAAWLGCLLFQGPVLAFPAGTFNEAISAPPYQEATNSGVQQPSLSPATGPRCGDNTTQVTLCFPGSATEAECSYVVTSGQNTAPAVPCPSQSLFGKTCSVLPGLLIVAYGPCNQGIAASQAQETAAGIKKPITLWLETLGLQSIQQIGGFLVRGYAYQATPDPDQTEAMNLLPQLKEVGDIVPVTLDNAKLSPLTIAGAFVPLFEAVEDLEGGMLIENTPNVNFTGLFGSLRIIKGPIIIVGNPGLESLAGLEGLAVHDALGNLEIFSNARLQDISALSSVLRCNKAGTSAITPADAVVGAIEVSVSLQSSMRCLLSTVTQVCHFIMDSSVCPDGTVSLDAYQYPVGTALAPAPLAAAPVAARLPLPKAIEPLTTAGSPASTAPAAG